MHKAVVWLRNHPGSLMTTNMVSSCCFSLPQLMAGQFVDFHDYKLYVFVLCYFELV